MKPYTHWVEHNGDNIGRAVVKGEQEEDALKLAAVELFRTPGIFFLALVDEKKLRPMDEEVFA